MQGLNKIVRSVISQPKDVFFKDLKENMTDRLQSKLNEKYKIAVSNLLMSEEIEPETLVVEEKQEKLDENISSFVKTLKESYFENKTILHKFRDGNTVAISPEDSFSLIQMHDSLNNMNQVKMRNLMSESFSEYNKILKFSKKHRKD